MATVTPEVEETGPVAPSEQPTVVSPDNPGGTVDRPVGLPENFKTVEALAEAFKKKQAELTRLQQGLPPKEEGEADEKPADSEQDKQDKAAEEVAQASGVDLTEYSNEFWETGDLSTERRGELVEKLGPKLQELGLDPTEAINVFVEGRKAMMKNETDLIYSEVGGKEAYTEIVTWAAKNLSPSERKAYDAAVTSGDIHSAQLAVGGLKLKYDKATGGTGPRLVQGDGKAGPSRYSKAQMKADMESKRYKTDADFRAEVLRKIESSKVMG